MRNEITLATAAALVGLPRNTLVVWRHRGHAPHATDLPSLVTLATVAGLSRVGVPPAVGSEIASSARGRWREALGTPGAVLVATPGAGAGWDVAVCRRAELPPSPVGI